jgi:hypothetical protein
VGTTDDVKEKVQERTTLARGEIWMLRIAAATGIASFISHGTDAAHTLLKLF